MGSGLYFSLDSLPARYREQVQRQLAPRKPVPPSDGQETTPVPPPKTAPVVVRNRSHASEDWRCEEPRRKKAKRNARFAELPEGQGDAVGKVRAPVVMTRRHEMTRPERTFQRLFLLGGGYYEPITLNLPGSGRYTPDFMYVDDADADGEDKAVSSNVLRTIKDIVLVEVKGAYHLQSHQRAATAFKTACATYPMFTFVWAEQQKNPALWRIALYRGGQQCGDAFLGTADEFHRRATSGGEAVGE